MTGVARAGDPEVWTVQDATLWGVADEQQVGSGPIAASAVPSAFTLSAAYPNPFGASATVGFALPEAAEVHLAVYDVLGRTVDVLVEGPLEAGQHTAQFEAAGLAPGVYLVRMTAGGFAQTQRVTLAR